MEDQTPDRLIFEPTKLWVHGRGDEGCLVFAGGSLIAVLVRLTEGYEDLAGRWFLEAGFGPCSEVAPPSFMSLDDARRWIDRQLADRA